MHHHILYDNIKTKIHLCSLCQNIRICFLLHCQGFLPNPSEEATYETTNPFVVTELSVSKTTTNSAVFSDVITSMLNCGRRQRGLIYLYLKNSKYTPKNHLAPSNCTYYLPKTFLEGMYEMTNPLFVTELSLAKTTVISFLNDITSLGK